MQTNTPAIPNDCFFPCYILACAVYATGMMSGSSELQRIGLLICVSLLTHEYTLSRPYRYWCEEGNLTFFQGAGDNEQSEAMQHSVMDV